MTRRSLLSFLAALAAGACGGGGGGGATGSPTLTAVTVAGDSTVVLAGTATLTATALAGTTPVTNGVTFTWSSSDPTVATVSPTGVVTGVARGTVTITALATTSSQPSGVSGTHAVRAKIGSIAIMPSAPSMASLGETVTLSAQARDASNAAVSGVAFSWSSGNTAVATVDAASGVVTAGSNGTAQISAAATGENLSASVTATVQQVATTLNILETDTTVDRIKRGIFTPVVSAQDARGNPVPNTQLSWVSRNTGVATVGASTGVVSSVNEGNTYIVASSGTLKDSVLFNVVLVYASVQITGSGLATPLDTALIRQLSGTLQLGTVVKDIGGAVVPTPVVSWALKNGTIASINSMGLITGNLNTGSDSVIETARTVRDTVPLIVRQYAATITVSRTPSTKSVESLNFVGDTESFAGSAKDAGNFAIPGKKFSWSSGNTAVLTVGAAVDTMTLATAVANGTTTVIASADGVSGSQSVTVQQVPAKDTMNPTPLPNLTAINATLVVTCVVLDSANVRILSWPCTWTSSNNAVATVTSPGPTTTVTAKTNGGTNILATAAAGVLVGNGLTVQQVPASIKLHPQTIDTSRILTSATMQFEKPVKDANGFTIDTATVTWSSKTAGWTVSSTGLVTAPGSAPGNSYIRASYPPLGTSGNDSAYVEVVSAAITLSGNAQPIFTSSCALSGCHAGASPQQGMNLSTGQTFSNVVNVQANESVLKRVLPSRPDSSYLVHKIQGTQLLPPANGSGSRMPEGCSGSSCLSRGQINIIRNWILQGAQNN